MKKAFGEYQRLARGTLGLSSVWMGGDHLLYVRGSGFLLPFTEEYKRFRYADIQGLVLARTGGWVLGALGYLAALAVAAGIGFALLFFREPGDVALLAIALAGPLPLIVLALALLIRHLVLGPRCVCEVQTGVKRERLRPISRLHQGREILAQLGGRIHAAQAGLVSSGAPAEGVPRPLPGERAGLSPALRLPPLGWLAFGVQGIAALQLFVVLHFPHTIISALLVALAFAGTFSLLIALAGSVRHPCPGSIRQALWSQLTTGLIVGALGLVYFAVRALEDPAYTLDLFGPLRAFAEIRAEGGLGFYLFFLLAGLAHLAVAVAGLILCLRWRGRLGHQPPPPKPAPDLPDIPIQQG